MDSNKLMKRVAYVIFGTYAIFNLITIILLVDKSEFGPEIAGPYSIFSSKNFFIAYHIWGIVIAIVCIYALLKEIRMLFMIGLLLMTLIMFYPYFTGSPMDKKQGEDIVKERLRKERLQDSLQNQASENLLDSLQKDS